MTDALRLLARPDKWYLGAGDGDGKLKRCVSFLLGFGLDAPVEVVVHHARLR